MTAEEKEMQNLFEEWYFKNFCKDNLALADIYFEKYEDGRYAYAGVYERSMQAEFDNFKSAYSFALEKETEQIHKHAGVYRKFMDSDGTPTDPAHLENLMDRLDIGAIAKSLGENFGQTKMENGVMIPNIVLGDGDICFAAGYADSEGEPYSTVIFKRMSIPGISGSMTSQEQIASAKPFFSLVFKNLASLAVFANGITDALAYNAVNTERQFNLFKVKRETEVQMDELAGKIKDVIQETKEG
jgi:hypothetical protein